MDRTPLAQENKLEIENASILFQGDSVTDNFHNRTITDANIDRALGTGYPFLVASLALRQHPTHGLNFFNRGVSGNKIPDLEARWQSDTLDLKPDVLSVLIGVNDFWHTMLNGYTGKILQVDLTAEAITIETPSEEFYRTLVESHQILVGSRLAKILNDGVAQFDFVHRLTDVANGNLLGELELHHSAARKVHAQVGTPHQQQDENREVNRRRGLADTAFLIGYADDLDH